MDPVRRTKICLRFESLGFVTAQRSLFETDFEYNYSNNDTNTIINNYQKTNEWL